MTSMRNIFKQRIRFISGLTVSVLVIALASGCGGPSVATPSEITAIPTVTATLSAPTAAVGATTGAPCESGTLHIKDLDEIQKRWQAGVSSTGQRAAGWQEDSYLVELAVSCELFESGFRWQSTYFSRNAQSYYRADTAEVIPANADPDTIIALPQDELDFETLMTVLLADPRFQLRTPYVITALDVRVSTATRTIGPSDVPTGATIYHVTIQAPGQTLELYVDVGAKKIYQFAQ
jgi:hypothetical protein